MQTLLSLPTWFDKDAARWTLEEQTMKQRFPHFTWGERLHPYHHRFWKGYLHPLYPGCDVSLLAAHLKQSLPVIVNSRGALLPTQDVLPLQIESRDELYIPYLVELVYGEPPTTPKVYVLYPKIDRTIFPLHPHMYANQHPLGNVKDAVCSFAPQDGEWNWETSTASKLLEWTSVWLANHILWVQIEDWLGPQASHETLDLYTSISDNSPCHCGSNTLYKNCHKPYDKQKLRKAKAFHSSRRLAK